MPTTTVKSIGTTGRDYSTLQAWEDACPANLVTSDEIWKGECYNDSEFTAGVAISGQTTDSTRYVWLTAASGQSFQDHASVRSNALFYDQAKGVGIAVGGDSATASYIIYGGSAYTLIERLQVKRTALAPYESNRTVGLAFTGGGQMVRDCILAMVAGTGRYVASSGGNAMRNCVIYSTTAHNGVYMNDGGTMLNCTVINGGGGPVTGITCAYFNGTVKNTAVFGYTTPMTSGYYTGTEYNGTDGGSFGGTNNQTSLTFADCFESTTADYRLKTSSPLIGVGNTDATNAPNDISGTARGSGTTGDIGAWEWSAGVAAAAMAFLRSGARQQHLLVR